MPSSISLMIPFCLMSDKTLVATSGTQAVCAFDLHICHQCWQKRWKCANKGVLNANTLNEEKNEQQSSRHRFK